MFIVKRQELVEAFVNDSGVRQSTFETLLSFPDLHRLAKKFQRGSGGLQDVVRIYQVVLKLPLLISELDGYSGINADQIKVSFTDLLKVITIFINCYYS